MVTKVETGIALNSRNKTRIQVSKILKYSPENVIIVENGDINEKITKVRRIQAKRQIWMLRNHYKKMRKVNVMIASPAAMKMKDAIGSCNRRGNLDSHH